MNIFRQSWFSVHLLIVLSNFDQSSGESVCGDWVRYKDEKCFKILDDTTRVYDDAQKSCMALDESYTLPIIRSKEEQEFLTNFLFKTQKKLENFWIAARLLDDKIKWIDNSEMAFSNWDARGARNKPNYCVEMQADESFVAKWIDEPCAKKNLVVCQRIQTWSIATLQKTLLDARKELRDSQEDAKNHIQNLELNPVPIGFIYIQIPGQPAPKSLWAKVEWKDVTAEYAGLFFRAEGGGSGAFEAIQEATCPRLAQIRSEYGENPEYEVYGGAPENILPGQWSRKFFSGCRCPDNHSALLFNVTADEVRPRNKAMRIWKRIK